MDELTSAAAPPGHPRSVGAAATFEDLFAGSSPASRGPIHHIVGDRSRAEEVTQDAFLELLRHWGTVAGYDRPDLWVRRVAIRKAQRERHRAWRRMELERSTAVDRLWSLRRQHPRCWAPYAASLPGSEPSSCSSTSRTGRWPRSPRSWAARSQRGGASCTRLAATSPRRSAEEVTDDVR